jgi:hypothetical protein
MENPYEPPSTAIQQSATREEFKETRVQFLIRATLALIIASIASMLLVDIWTTMVDQFAILSLSPSRVLFRVAMLAGEALTIIGAWLLLRRRARATTAFVIACLWWVALAILGTKPTLVFLAFPAALGLICVFLYSLRNDARR